MRFALLNIKKHEDRIEILEKSMMRYSTLENYAKTSIRESCCGMRISIKANLSTKRTTDPAT